MTGWRLGFAHGPRRLIQRDDQAAAVHVCLRAAAGAVGGRWRHGRRHQPTAIADYRRKRDLIVAGLATTLRTPGAGRGVLRFPQGPLGHGHRVRRRGDREQPADHPRQRLQPRDTHFRISYAADGRTLERGIEVLRKLAKKRG